MSSQEHLSFQNFIKNASQSAILALLFVLIALVLTVVLFALAFSVGTNGQQGPQGAQGSIGQDGPEGPIGPDGPQGAKGPIGYQNPPLQEFKSDVITFNNQTLPLSSTIKFNSPFNSTIPILSGVGEIANVPITVTYSNITTSTATINFSNTDSQINVPPSTFLFTYFAFTPVPTTSQKKIASHFWTRELSNLYENNE